MKKSGVIGWPVSHSKSPLIHNYWLKKNNIDGSYEKIELLKDDFKSGVLDLVARGFVGANVTVPHKEAALELADERTARAQKIGAANTLIFKDNKIIADNTDGEGFINNLMQSAPSWNAAMGPALVLGAGGAARGIIYALLEAGVPEIILVNRTRTRAENLAQHFGANIVVANWENIPDILGAITTLVNTTSLGMKGSDSLVLPLDNLKPSTLVTDIVYTPLETELLKTARAKGCQTVDGLGMLLHQAVPGFEAWFGVRPVVDDVLRQIVLAKE